VTDAEIRLHCLMLAREFAAGHDSTLGIAARFAAFALDGYGFGEEEDDPLYGIEPTITPNLTDGE
jgi:hypothetical protein